MSFGTDIERRVIISLGGGLNPRHTPNSPTVARLEKTLELHNSGSYPRIITTARGTFRDLNNHSVTEAEAGKKWLVEKGVDPKVILLQDKAMDTIGEPYFCRSLYLDPLGLASPTIVTNNFHLKRTKLLFGLVLGKGYEPDYIGVDNTGLSVEDLEKRRKHENFMSFFYLWYFDGIKRGDMEVFKHYIERHNPAYTGRIDKVHTELTQVITEIWRT